MSVDLVVARYCEDISWISAAPDAWNRVVYDKSQGGPRQRITVGSWSSADGPEEAELWPYSVPLENVGTETHTYMTHIVRCWDGLADYTVFLPGDAQRHVPSVLSLAEEGIMQTLGYVPFGDHYVCDSRGRPNVPHGFDELSEGFKIFYPNQPLPATFCWTGFSMFLARRDRIQRFSLQQWQKATSWCQLKIHALAMERLHDLLLG